MAHRAARLAVGSRQVCKKMGFSAFTMVRDWVRPTRYRLQQATGYRRSSTVYDDVMRLCTVYDVHLYIKVLQYVRTLY